MFEKHLASFSSEIQSILQAVIDVPPHDTSDAETSNQVAILSARHKRDQIELESAQARHDSLLQRLDEETTARQRLERLVDRLQSPIARQVDQLSSSSCPAPVPGQSVPPTEPSSQDPLPSPSLQPSLNEAQAVAESLRTQIQALESQNEKLENDISRHLTRLATLTDDDYAHTELHHALSSRCESLLSQVNHLQGTVEVLTHQNSELEQNKTGFRRKIEEDTSAHIQELTSRLEKSEADLSRVRQVRDEYLAELSSLRSRADELEAAKQSFLSELGERDHRIEALESESQRLRITVGGSMPTRPDASNIDSLTEEQLRRLVAENQTSQHLLTAELSAMAKAYQKASALASERHSVQQKFDSLLAQKSKLDERVFSFMKRLETLETENRCLRSINSSNSELLSKLKEADQNWKVLCSKLEKQISTIQTTHDTLFNQHSDSVRRLSEATSTIDTLDTQVADCKKLLQSRNGELAAATRLHRMATVELEGIRAKFAESRKAMDLLKKKARSGQTDEELMLRVCNSTTMFCPFPD